MSVVLVTGVTGQDGILLARQLRRRGHVVVGTGRTAETKHGHLLDDVHLETLDVCDTRAFRILLNVHRPDIVVNLAALSSVGKSWKTPEVAREVNGAAVVRMLDAISDLPEPPRFVQASSSEVFGPPTNPDEPATEITPRNPVSPYASAKAMADDAVRHARDSGLRASSLFLFGHTSALQAATFVLPGVANQAAEIALGRRETLLLRDPTINRDWGSARDTARAFAAAIEHDPVDLVIGTGQSTSLRQIASWALEAAGTSAQVRSSGEAGRPADFGDRVADSSLAAQVLGWQPEVSLEAEIGRMVRVSIRRLSGVEPLEAGDVD